MKKSFLLVIAFVLVTSAAFSQNVITLFNNANNFFDLLQQEKYLDAHANFEESFKLKLSPDNLMKLWTDLTTKLGKPLSLESIQSKTEGQYFSVTVEGKFEKGEQNFLVGFNKDQKIVGLFFVPAKIANAYQKPVYADTNLYKEKSVYLPIAGHQLAAIVTTPKNVKSFPMVVLVHGSGPSDMDETVGANKPFKDIAAGLAAKGIGTVRYVKRTLIYPNEFAKAYTVKEEVLDDAVSAIAMAKTVVGADKSKIYVMGHSLGGMLAPRLANLSPDLAGIVLAAAPAQKFTDIIEAQNKYMFNLLKDTTEASKKILADAMTEIEKTRISSLGTLKPDSLILGLPASYWVDLNKYDQVATAKSLNKQRILIIQGGNDFQVTKTDFDIWNAALSNKKNVKLTFYPDLNHLLSPQKEKGTTQQYQTPVSVSAQLINDLVLWIKGK
ncbi:alpha/beta hydrolase [Pedobacter sp. MW01-1-1]|uniref:alpha/beta hydrolase n=1 Tax=Pedobacter sp. MW01-1-1 TaxID=3383027 RepID=UPI003FEE151D